MEPENESAPTKPDEEVEKKETEGLIEVESSSKSGSRSGSDENGKSQHQNKNEEVQTIPTFVKQESDGSKKSSSSQQKVEEIALEWPSIPTPISKVDQLLLPISKTEQMDVIVSDEQVKPETEEVQNKISEITGVEPIPTPPAGQFESIEQTPKKEQQAHPLPENTQQRQVSDQMHQQKPILQAPTRNDITVAQEHKVSTSTYPTSNISNISDDNVTNKHLSNKTADTRQSDSRPVEQHLTAEAPDTEPQPAMPTEVLSAQPGTSFIINEQDHLAEDDRISIRLSDIDKDALRRHQISTQPLYEQEDYNGTQCQCLLI